MRKDLMFNMKVVLAGLQKAKKETRMCLKTLDWAVTAINCSSHKRAHCSLDNSPEMLEIMRQEVKPMLPLPGRRNKITLGISHKAWKIKIKRKVPKARTSIMKFRKFV